MRVSALLRNTLLAIAVSLTGAPRALAQVGASTDIIMSKVTGLDTTPVAGARVEVTSSETGITRCTTTNERGEYSILFPDGGCSWLWLRERAIRSGAQHARDHEHRR